MSHAEAELMDRLETAISGLELALVRSANLPITDVWLLRRRRIIKLAYDEAVELFDIYKRQMVQDRALGSWFEKFANCATKFLRDLEASIHPCALIRSSSISSLPAADIGNGPNSLLLKPTVPLLLMHTEVEVDADFSRSRWHSFLVKIIKTIAWILRDICTAAFSHCTPAADQIVEQQERCSQYSQQAIVFAISAASGYLLYGSSSTGDTGVKVAMVAAFIAIIADLTSLRMKPNWGRALVYISSFHLLVMTFLIFTSFNKDYGYAILFVPLMIAATYLWHNLWPGARRQLTDVPGSQELDFMFRLSALILNCDSIITMIITVSAHLTSGANKYVAASAARFLLFFTVVLALYLMMVTTVRTVALIAHAKYLDILLMVLLVSTLVATSITFIKL